MAIEIAPFHADMVAEAGRLLATRHAADRRTVPLLPPRFEDAGVAAAAVAKVVGNQHTSGVAALAEGRLAGFMIGDTVFDETWGRAGWVRLPGHALAPGQDVELTRDLYTALATPWVKVGCYAHYAMVSTANPALIDAWFRLSFGVEQMHALCDLRGVTSVDPGRFEIRRATADDRDTLAAFSGLIWQQQVAPPVWAFTSPERAAELPRDYASEVDDPEAIIWLAFENDQAVGVQIYYPYPEDADTLLVPPHCVALGVAGTMPAARGHGVQSAMTRFCLPQLRDQGYAVCETDWRSANLLSSRAWPRLGYTPVVYRLSRRIDPRIAFAASPD